MFTKTAVIREPLVALVGKDNWIAAIFLNQFIYWTERMRDTDAYIQEESSRMQASGLDEANVSLSNGWIYKTCEQLSDETMVSLTPASVRKYITVLVSNEWLDERRNPIHKWDRTLQYRVNLHKIINDLSDLGYTLDAKIVDEITKTKIRILENKNQSTKILHAIPEITTKNTLKSNGQKNLAHEPLENNVLKYEPIKESPKKNVAQQPDIALVKPVFNAVEKNADKQSDRAASDKPAIIADEDRIKFLWLREHLRPLAIAFVENAGTAYLPRKRDTLWYKVLNDWQAAGATPRDIKSAVKKMHTDRLTIGGVQSITKVLKSVIAQRQRRDIEEPVYVAKG